MSTVPVASAGANPFSLRAVLLLVSLGSLIFVALLWMIGAGMTTGSTNDGGGHAGGRGLNGFAGLARLVEAQGRDVQQIRTAATLEQPGLLVLTPPQDADGAEIDQIVSARRGLGPTLIIAPKWNAATYSSAAPGVRQGWVQLNGTRSPHWPGFLDDVGVKLGSATSGGESGRWRGAGESGRLPAPEAVQSGSGRRLVPLATGDRGEVLAAYIDDGGAYPELERLAGRSGPASDEDHGLYPIVLVFEPDLLDNYGFARKESALFAVALVDAATAQERDMPLLFDLTLNGHGRSANLLTLAFTPPFLAATLCLLMAALAVAWRAFLRFGTPRPPARAIAFGKRALVANAAGLVRRTRRFHLISGPYLRRSRERIARALALPPSPTHEALDAAIDGLVASRSPGSPPYTATATRLQAARKPHDLLRAAQDLHAIERTLIG